MFKRVSAWAMALALLLAPGLGAAEPVVSLVAEPPKLHQSPVNVSVDVILSGLRSLVTTQPGENLLGALDLTLSYDPTVLTLLPSGFRWGTALGNPRDAAQTFTAGDVSAPGVFRFIEVSLLTEAELATLQPDDSITLATVLFYYDPRTVDPAISSTTLSILDYDPLASPPGSSVLSDALGADVAFLSVPLTLEIAEPGSSALAAAALAALLMAPRRRPARPAVQRCIDIRTA